MNDSIEKYAQRVTLKRLRERNYCTVPANMQERLPRFKNIAAVLWDIYGTIMEHSKGDMVSSDAKRQNYERAFGITAREFDLQDFLGGNPAETLRQIYEREIAKTQQRKLRRGLRYPEVRIERIWLRILKQLEAKGYRPDRDGKVDLALAMKVAYFFDMAEQAKDLYPGVLQALEGVKKLGLRQGIISNSQFYTPLALSILLRRAGYRNDPLRHLFDRRLLFLSYRLGISKPNPAVFQAARERLSRMGIEPEQTIYIGNDNCNDMVPARQVGFKCVLFAGDRESLALRQDRMECIGFQPDGVIKALPDILDIVN
ncbi:MAG: HAD family hydrolase [Candidatus Abyssubacteria bacterium]